jgi:hypothetical protein
MALPFLAIPLLIVGKEVLKMTFENVTTTVDDFKEANKVNEKAKKIYDEAQEKLNIKRKKTNSHLEKLGELKIFTLQNLLIKFVNTYSKIKNVDFKHNLNLDQDLNINKKDILNIEDTVVKMQEVLGGGIAALGSGALAGFGALGGVGMLASASTGTAISTLSGAAATNATLAWLGGGSLAAGGLGIGGGMMVLGGIVTIPVLAVAGFVAASKAEEAKHTAYKNHEKAKAAVEEMDTAGIVLNGIYKRTDETMQILEKLNSQFAYHIYILEEIINRSNNYINYSRREKETVMITASLAKTVKNIYDAPIIDKNGKVTQQSQKVLETARKIMQEIEKVG